jgi:hypothetical protein
LASGTGLFWMLLVSIFLIYLAIVLMRRLFSSSNKSLSQKNISRGLLIMLIPLGVLSVLEAKNATDFWYQLLAATSVSYFFSALIGVPVTFFLDRYKVASCTAILVCTFTAIELGTYISSLYAWHPDISIAQWHGMILQNLIYCSLLSVAFCLGSGIQLLPNARKFQENQS